MNNWNKTSRNEESKDDKPPFSRLFIVCGKRIREGDLRPAFERFGDIQDFYMPRNRNTGESLGVAYVKYSKTSHAANAIREMHLKTINNDTKLKVMIASKNDKNQNISDDKFTRLFIKVAKEDTEHQIKQHFDVFGKVDSVFIIKDKVTQESKGVAYVKYDNFLDTAKAFEECDRKYKPIFALPKDELKRNRDSLETNTWQNNDRPTVAYKQQHSSRDDTDITSLLSTTCSQSYNSVIVTCSPLISQKHVESLFNIIPGMMQCQYTVDSYNSVCRAIITYQEEKAAAHAVERLNNFEFPSGELLSVKPNDNPLAKAANNLADIMNTFKNGIDVSNPNLTVLAEAIAQASTLIKEAATSKAEMKEGSFKYSHNVDLPMPEPMASSGSEVAQKLFIVCKPQPPPLHILKDIFCRFGNLIHISTFPNKTYAFVKYASTRSAFEAIKVLNGAVLGGVNFKVMEAVDKQNNDDSMNIDLENEDMEKRKNNFTNVDMDQEHDSDRKRMKLDKIIDVNGSTT